MHAANLSDVFGVGSDIRPRSYVDRGKLDERFRYTLGTGRHIVIHGDSKQGKSWLRSRVLPPEETIVVQCHRETTIESLLVEALGRLGVRAELRFTGERRAEGTLDFSGSGDVGVKILTRLGFKVGAKGVRGHVRTTEFQTLGQTPADLSWVGGVLSESDKRLVVEDFHYVSEGERRRFAFTLKALGEYGVYPVIVGVWPQDHLLTYYNGDLEGRVEDIHLTWAGHELAEVLDKGANELNITFSKSLKRELIEDAHGNVGLLQRLAERFCIEAGIIRSQRGESGVLTPGPQLERARTAVASAMRARFEGFADQFVHGMRSLPQTSETAYLYILQALAELPDQDLIAGIGVAALGARIGAAGRAKDLRGALERLDRFQAKLDINPLVLTYSTHTRKVALVDRSFLFFRKHGEPRWPWE